MPDVKSITVHQREVSVFLTAAEVVAVLKNYAMERAGYKPGAPNLTLKLRLEDEMTGSPEYKSGTKARIDIVEALGGEPAQVG